MRVRCETVKLLARHLFGSDPDRQDNLYLAVAEAGPHDRAGCDMNLRFKLAHITALVVLVAAPALSSCGQEANFHSSLFKRATLVFPFEFVNNQIIVRLSLNGIPGNFILDTGASKTTLNLRAAEAAHLKMVKNVGSANGLGKSCAIEMAAENVDIKDAKIEILNGTAPVVDLSQLEKGLGVPLEGILGFDYLRLFPILVDYRAKTITFFEDKQVQYRGPEASIPLLLDGDTPVVVATTWLPDGSRADARLEIDTGYYGALDLHGPFVQKHPSVEADPKTQTAEPPSDLQDICGYTFKELSGKISAIQIGNARFPDPQVFYAQTPTGISANSQTDGELGNAFLSQFSLFLDAPQHLLVLDR